MYRVSAFYLASACSDLPMDCAYPVMFVVRVVGGVGGRGCVWGGGWGLCWRGFGGGALLGREAACMHVLGRSHGEKGEAAYEFHELMTCPHPVLTVVLGCCRG